MRTIWTCLPGLAVIGAFAYWAAVDEPRVDVAAVDPRAAPLRRLAVAIRDVMREAESKYEHHFEKVFPEIRARFEVPGSRPEDVLAAAEASPEMTKLRELGNGINLLVRFGGLWSQELAANADILSSSASQEERERAHGVSLMLVRDLAAKVKDGLGRLDEAFVAFGLEPMRGRAEALAALEAIGP